jgi:hypothetical protein
VSLARAAGWLVESGEARVEARAGWRR